MQSEFSCHIGLRGKLFYRACWVKGSDALEGARLDKDTADTPDISPALTPNVSDNEADDLESNFRHSSTMGRVSASEPYVPPRKTKKGKETMEAMLSRVMSFVKALIPVIIMLI